MLPEAWKVGPASVTFKQIMIMRTKNMSQMNAFVHTVWATLDTGYAHSMC